MRSPRLYGKTLNEVKRRLRPIDVELVLLSGGLFIVKPLYRSKWPMGPVLNSSFLSMKRLGVLLLPPGWDASPLQDYPQHIC